MKKGLLILTVCLMGILAFFSVSYAQSSGKTVDGGGSKPASKGIEAGATLSINDSGKDLAYNCSNTSITVNGSNNKITLTGTCSSISINGSNNTIRMNCRISSISAMGSSNRISYSEKLNQKKPAFNSLGYDNTLTKTP
ncbi:MAG: DUF3060 domain-containing protein [Firmicutes bacterium]|nr:DUF3060 domain-containing protein [Bacillota bacterium]